MHNVISEFEELIQRRTNPWRQVVQVITRNYIWYAGVQYLCALIMELASWHPLGAQNFEVAQRFLEKLAKPSANLHLNLQIFFIWSYRVT
jgi:hypothetical protein